MTEQDLKQIFQKKYSFENWRPLLSHLFKQTEIFVSPSDIKTSKDEVNKISQLGNIKIINANLGVFEVEVADKIDISRNRVALRNISAKYVDQDIINGAFVFFYNPNQEIYRFTFVAKSSILQEDGSIEKFQTHPRRYTYVFGPEEAGTTAAKRFMVLLENELISLNDLIEAFSVEKLNKEFFKKYREQYDKFYSYLLENYSSIVNKDDSEKKKICSNYVKLLLGRIVFLFFLQKKGWLGCPPDRKDWKFGEKEFVQNLFKNFKRKNKFNSECLSELFYNTLNNDSRSNNIFKLTNTRIPYLNGGLFEDRIEELHSVDFPSDYFEELINFFSQYNFTINESDPEEHEVGIDPEMLGHIFENLLEENRSKGTFYTPKEIVHFMCQESLIEYLSTHLTENLDTKEANKIKVSVTSFIREGISPFILKSDNPIRKYAQKIDTLLDQIKICDPAIGSGAFPMGLLLEIYKAKMNLNLTLDPAEVKKNIIQNSIYGVDIEKGAVDIARLRFWLSLVVDEEEPRPLPNLDFKIMQGNSLLESFLGVDLRFSFSKLKMETYSEVDLFGRLLNPQISFMEFLQTQQTAAAFNFTELEEKFFDNSNLQEKNIIRNKVYEFEKKFIVEQLKEKISQLNRKLNKIISEFEQFKKINKSLLNEEPSNNGEEKKKKTALRKQKLYEKEIASLNSEIIILENGISQIEEMSIDEKPYFLWHLYFMDIFQNGGFDIVIGNPPYIQLQKIREESLILEKENYQTFSRTGDIYCLFYELGINILKSNGILTFITSNTWMRTNFGELLRNFFISNSNPIKLINFQDTQIFQTVTVETCILVTKKQPWLKQLQSLALRTDYIIGTPIAPYFEKNFVLLDDLTSRSWIILPQNDVRIKRQIEDNGIKLGEWDVQINFGIKTGYNDAFFIDDNIRRELISLDPNCKNIIKPLVRGREIRKYVYDFNEQYLIFTRRDFQISKYPVIEEYLNKFKKKLIPRPNDWDEKRNGQWEGRKPGDYKWFEFQDNIAFHKNFDRPKIIWLTITDKPAFAIDCNKMYVSSPAYIMTTPYLKFHLSILNSKISEWYLDKVTSSTGQGANQWTKIFIEQIPIPKIHFKLRKIFENLADYLVFLYSSNNPKINPYTDNVNIAPVFEDLLNMCVYELYFTEHMKNIDVDVLRFIDLPEIDSIKNDTKKAEIINNVYKNLQTQENPIRNRIITANLNSPDIIRRINSTTH